MKSSPAQLASAISAGRWQFAPHLEYLDKLLVNIADRKIKKLIINMPPRHGKSEIISCYFPAWYLLRNPNHRVILASYQSSLAKQWSRRIRDLFIQYSGEYFDLAVNPDVRAADNFLIDGAEGGLLAVGANGSITGRGADLLIIDDPIKNDREAFSPVMRDNLWNWFNATAFTRLEPNGIILVVMTRWHRDDLTGRLLMKNNVVSNPDLNDINLIISPKKWVSVSLPMLADENDILGRKLGEPLWKERFDDEAIDDIRTTLGAYWFNALYQQSPMSDSESRYKRKHFKYFTEDIDNYITYEEDGSTNKYLKFECVKYVTVDLAITTGQKSDYTVAIVFALNRNKEVFVIEVIRNKLEGSEHLDMIIQINARWKPLLIGIEAVQYQASLIQTALKNGLPVKSLHPNKDKFHRSLKILNLMENKKVFFSANATWLTDFEEELLDFPDGKHDDQADAFAYIANFVELNTQTKPVGAKRKDKNVGHLQESML